jgi:hypothetical protein
MTCRQSRVSLSETRSCAELEDVIAAVPDRDSRIRIWLCKRMLLSNEATIMTAIASETVLDSDITAELDKITSFIRFHGQ